MFQTIRGRLALWNFFIIFFILLLFSLSLYFNAAEKSRVEQRVQLDEMKEWVADQLFFQDGQVEFAKDSLSQKPIQDLTFYIHNDDGLLLFQEGVIVDFKQKVKWEEKIFDSHDINFDNHVMYQVPYRFLSAQEELGEEEGVVGEALLLWITAGLPIDFLESDLFDLRWYLIGLSSLLLIGTFTLTLLLTGHLLRPLKQMAQSADEISEKNLDQSLPIINPKDETGQLGLAFNRLFERLHDAFESQRRFVADASHELRTPLTVLQGKLEVALGKRRSDDDYIEVIQTSLAQTNRLSELVQRLLLLARADAGRLEAEKKPVDLAQMVKQFQDQIHPLLSQRKLQFSTDIKAHPNVIGDKELLNQAILNLLENAIKYTPDGGAVSLSLDMDKQDAVLKVTDTGTGIAAEELDQVFERFYRVDKARSVTVSGLGLGLSIVSEIVAHHEGQIHIDSRLNQGTCVEVWLPLKQSEPSD